MANLNQDQLRRLARLGAVARLEQLRDEEAAIRAAFPELFGGRRSAGTRGGTADGKPRRKASRTRKRKPMTSAQKKAVSDRMRKYWAERRKASAK